MADTRKHSRRGLKFRANLILAVSIWAMFVLSTADWSLALANTLAVLKDQQKPRLVMWANIVNAVIRLNTVIADAVLVWRVRVISRHEYPKLLAVAIASFCLTAASACATICLRATLSIMFGTDDARANSTRINSALVVIQILTFAISFITNVITTSIIGLYVWYVSPLRLFDLNSFLQELYSMERSANRHYLHLRITKSGRAAGVEYRFEYIRQIQIQQKESSRAQPCLSRQNIAEQVFHGIRRTEGLDRARCCLLSYGWTRRTLLQAVIPQYLFWKAFSDFQG
ncbi:uncharacterized protein STEHIDRAFT_106588 [Stereum hirsutum FP-91666 SS1]|uniref:uncharacterized protein n=1 Tax=Stereum hirsutum (strain FP-91666) TaxID=721885 RepID=UPI000440F87B|nr:uncharacterized protein STEHIDRAFT_106588 [Stereum hirsutum FP-91666 SS1]EIM91905.1 hypothetical protein STEHIDRAFT_106588 [Stereum hirsutum FP-91666 SS1]